MRRYLGKWRYKKYGLTEQQYGEMLKAQAGVCAICQRAETRVYEGHDGRVIFTYSIDHDHQRGQKHVRGLLCSKCNIGLGSFEDNPQLLRAAAIYIEEHQKPLDYVVPWIMTKSLEKERLN